MKKVEAYQRYVWPLLEMLPANKTHELGLELMQAWQKHPWMLEMVERLLDKDFTSDKLEVVFGGMVFENPIVLAAGFDKDGKVVRAIEALNFGGMEVGSVLAKPQRGNEWPNIFRPEKGSLLNRMGFPSEGVGAVKQHLMEIGKATKPLGINVGINKGELLSDIPRAYGSVVSELFSYGDFFVLNFSSPNTANLRDIQRDQMMIADIVSEVFGVMIEKGERKPMYIKISPDESQETLAGLIKVIRETGVKGLVVANTSNNEAIKEGFGGKWKGEAGGVSGKAIREINTRAVREIKIISGGEIEIAACGGIYDVDSAVEKIKVGATILEVYTGFIYGGPFFANWLNAGLLAYMEHEGISNLSEIK